MHAFYEARRSPAYLQNQPRTCTSLKPQPPNPPTQTPKQPNPKQAEKLNGRMAMLGFIALLATEFALGGEAFTHGLLGLG